MGIVRLLLIIEWVGLDCPVHWFTPHTQQGSSHYIIFDACSYLAYHLTHLAGKILIGYTLTHIVLHDCNQLFLGHHSYYRKFWSQCAVCYLQLEWDFFGNHYQHQGDQNKLL